MNLGQALDEKTTSERSGDDRSLDDHDLLKKRAQLLTSEKILIDTIYDPKVKTPN